MRDRGRVERKIQKAIGFILIAIIAVAVFGFLVKGLWNWLMPVLFGLHAITFWQAVGLLVLAKLLFGGFRGGSGANKHWRSRMKEKWAQMTPEEREKFAHGMQRHWGRECWTRERKAEL
jgi:Ca2+/H+ antiporter, TMEM165/GDT1 family